MRETYLISPREAPPAVFCIASASRTPLHTATIVAAAHASRRDAMAVDLVGTKTTAASIFLEHGVAVLPGAVKKETAAACRAAASTNVQQIIEFCMTYAAPIKWFGLNFSGFAAFGPSERCFAIQAGYSPMD